MSHTPISKAPVGFLQKFLCLRLTPRELWIIYIAYVLENLAYQAGAASVLPLWLSSDLGFSDENAGWMISLWSALITLVTVCVGSLTDAIGIRKTFLIGFVICLVSRIIMTVSSGTWLAVGGGMFPQAVGIALMIPVMASAVKRYTTAAQRSIAFSLYYALMNLGFAIGSWLIDRVRASPPVGLGENGTWTMPVFDAELSTYRVLIFLSLVFTVPGLLLIWGFVREGVEMTENGIVFHKREEGSTSASWSKALWENTTATTRKTVRIFVNLWKQPAFHRFLIFMSLAVGVKMIFFHLNYTFPKFAIRELGDGAPFASLTGMLNSILIVVLVPICGALTQNINAYRMVTVGSMISALSVFFIAMPPEWFQPLADGWMGHMIGHVWLGVQGEVSPLYISIFLFIVFLSIGEAIYSPRLFEYCAAVAPNGQEASYMALSQLPFFLAKFVTGWLSGQLLTSFCPEQGERNPEMMWLIIGGMALITPVGTIVLRKYIQTQEEGRHA